MKKLLLSVSVLLTAIGANAQAVSHGSHTAASTFTISNYTADLWGSTSDGLMMAHLKVHNTASINMTVNCEKIVIDTVPGTINSICWGQYCWPDNVYLTPIPSVIPGNGVDSTFRGDYSVNGKVGTTVMRYLFTDKNDASDSISVVIRYHVTPTGINNTVLAESKITASPNPANGMTFIGTSLAPQVQKAKIVIHNMLGAVVEEIALDPKEIGVLLVTENYQSGIYFYSLVTDNKTVSTRKLVVSH